MGSAGNIILVQSAHLASDAATFPQPVTSGNTVVIFYQDDYRTSSNSWTVSDTAGNSYTQTDAYTNLEGNLLIAWSAGVTAGPGTFTITALPSITAVTRNVVIAEFSGVIGVYDTSNATNGTVVNIDAFLTTTNAKDLILLLAGNLNPTTVYTADTGFLIYGTGEIGVQYQGQTVAGLTVPIITSSLLQAQIGLGLALTATTGIVQGKNLADIAQFGWGMG